MSCAFQFTSDGFAAIGQLHLFDVLFSPDQPDKAELVEAAQCFAYQRLSLPVPAVAYLGFPASEAWIDIVATIQAFNPEKSLGDLAAIDAVTSVRQDPVSQS